MRFCTPTFVGELAAGVDSPVRSRHGLLHDGARLVIGTDASEGSLTRRVFGDGGARRKVKILALRKELDRIVVDDFADQ